MTIPQTNSSACPEKRVLVCCARTRLGGPERRAIRELLGRSIDWSYLMREADEHSLVPLVERHLRACAADLVPAEIARQLAEASRANTVRCLYLASELGRVLDEFRSKSILGIPYKGPALAVQAYGDVTAREFGDLDIILRQRDLPKAHKILSNFGYRPRFPWIHSPEAHESIVPGEYNYRDEKRRIMLELHTERTLRHFPVAPDLEAMAQRLCRVNLAGHAVETFSAKEGLTALCIHGAKDFWEKILWVADISELVQSQPLDWKRALEFAETIQAGRMLRLGLALASQLLDMPVPPEISRVVRSDATAVRLAEKIVRRLLEREPPSAGAPERLLFRRRMVPGFTRGWGYAARLALTPSEEDWEGGQSPGRWKPLHSLTRPWRLLRKFGPAGRGEQGIPS